MATEWKKKNKAKSKEKKKKEKEKEKGGIEIEGYRVEGISISGHETCVIFPALNLSFDIGRCPLRAVSQDFLFISHAHLDHIGGLPMYVATRGLFSMKPPTIFVPKAIKEDVEKLFDVHRAMEHSELVHNLVALDVGEEFNFRKDLKVRAFKTHHVIPSQGYLIYSIKHKLKEEYKLLSKYQIRDLKLSGVEVTNSIASPEVAFTGDTTADFIVDPDNADVLNAKILVMECTFLDNQVSVGHAREYGHTHLTEVVKYGAMFQNKAILLIHFSARYQSNDIEEAISKLPAPFTGRVFALTEGF